MNPKRKLLLGLAISGGLFVTGIASALSQGTPMPIIDSLVTSFTFPAAQQVTPLFKFGHTIGGDPAKGAGSEIVVVNYLVSPAPDPDPLLPPILAELFEDNTRVAGPSPIGPRSLSYTPTSPGSKTLTIVLIEVDGSQTTSAGIIVQMYGTKLQTTLGTGVTPPFLPFTSRIFLEADSLIVDGNVKEAQFFHRSLPFQITTGVPYSSADKVLSNGKLFKPLISVTYQPGSTPPSVNTVGDTTISNNGNYKYVGPRLVSGVDYYNYLEPTDETVVLPNPYPAPPRGLADLVISIDSGSDNVYQVTTAGRLDPLVAIPSLAATGGDATGVVEFTFAGNALLASHTYTAGELVLSNGRIYEVVQGGKTPSDLGPGLTQTDGEVATLGTAAFNFIPTKVLKDELAYWLDDLVISNGHIYRVTINGTLAAGALGTGLHSLSAADPETKAGVVKFQMVGAPFDTLAAYSSGMIVSNNGRIYKVVGPEDADPEVAGSAPTSTDPYVLTTFGVGSEFSFELVLPQFQRYAQINSDYAGVPLEQNVVYHAGDFVVSNGKIYQVSVGGTMGPVGAGLTSLDSQTLGGLTFQYVGVFAKQISTIHPFPDVPFPYSSFDYSFPYTLKWSPADTITNQYSWFGTAGYFESHTDLELVTRTTDSKDRTNSSTTVPVSILPPIDARAAITVTITSPDPSRLIAAGTITQITAEAKDVNGVVKFVNSVQFFVDGVPLFAPDTTFPYSTEDPSHWTPTIAGTYILNAVAVDDKGNYTISPDVRVNVTDNQPFVRLTSPDAGDPFNPIVIGSGQTIEVEGIASGSGGDPNNIVDLQVFSDGNAITAPVTRNADGTFSFTYLIANATSAPINYQLTVRATDANGATVNSNSIYVQVTATGASPSPTPIAVPVTQFAQASVTVNSTQASAALDVVLQRPAGDTDSISVSYSTRDGTALAGRDYVSTSGTVVFNSGDTLKTIMIPLVSQALPTDRTFSVTLSNPSSGVIGLPPTEFVTITSVDLSTKVTNISTRGSVETGDSVMIAGFIVSGEGSKQVVARGI